MQITVLNANGRPAPPSSIRPFPGPPGHRARPRQDSRADAGLIVVEGDARDPDDLGKALIGSDAVISTRAA